MADFKRAHGYISQHEGGYVNDPKDKGGETYRGISRVNFPDWSGWDTVDAYKPLKKGEIINSGILDATVDEFFKREFWDTMKGDHINDQAVATYIYDWKVTSGKAVKLVQRLLGVDDDGIIGPGTVAAINGADNTLLQRIHNARVAYYQQIGVNGNEKFLQGWLNRANKLYEKLH